MYGKITAPEDVKPHRKYWLQKDGTAYQTDDHLMAAKYIQADSDEYERRMPWGYEDMFRHGWMRIHTEADVIWADGGSCTMTSKQRLWLQDAAVFLGAEAGTKVRVSKGIDSKEQIISREDKAIEPTKSFLKTLQEIAARYL